MQFIGEYLIVTLAIVVLAVAILFIAVLRAMMKGRI
jgi:hypothetical protein